MSSFEMEHHEHVTGKLACIDRLIFKGHLTGLFGPGRFKAFLASQGVLLKVFASGRCQPPDNQGVAG